MDTKKLQFHYFIGLLLIVLALALALFWPFLASIALAFMAAIIVRPIHRRFMKMFRGKATIAALSSVVFVLVVILVPLAIVTEQIAVESVNFYAGLQSGGSGGVEGVAAYILKPIQSVIPGFDPDIQGYLASLSDTFVKNAQGIVTGTASFALNLFMAVVSLFYMLRDGHRFRKTIIELSPLADKYDEEIISRIEQAVNSVVRGSLFVALLRGALTAIGFAIFGVPHPVLWGAVTGLLSLLPNIGFLITLIPALFYLASSSVGAAIGLAVWSIVLIGFIDNIVMPVVMGKGFTVHPLFVLISVLGGLVFFGPIGLLLGPLVIALLAALLEIYKLLVIEDHQRGAGAFLRQ